MCKTSHVAVRPWKLTSWVLLLDGVLEVAVAVAGVEQRQQAAGIVVSLAIGSKSAHNCRPVLAEVVAAVRRRGEARRPRRWAHPSSNHSSRQKDSPEEVEGVWPGVLLREVRCLWRQLRLGGLRGDAGDAGASAIEVVIVGSPRRRRWLLRPGRRSRRWARRRQ